MLARKSDTCARLKVMKRIKNKSKLSIGMMVYVNAPHFKKSPYQSMKFT